MNLLEKIKTVNIKSKWIYLCCVLVLLAVIGGSTGVIMYEKYMEANEKGMYGYQVYCDLLYLENTDNLKLSSDQARSILPLAEKLATATSSARADIMKNIYSQLSPQQYYALSNGESGPLQNRSFKDGKRSDRFIEDWKRGNEWESSNIRNETVKNIVIKFLKDKSSQ